MIDKKVKAMEVVIIQEGILDLDSLYSDLKSWFDENKYVFFETKHETKESNKGKIIVYNWTSERKTTEYIKFIIEVNFLIKEVLKEKDKYSGKLNLKISSNLELDYKTRWQGSQTKNVMFRIYNNLIKKQEIQDYKGKLIKETSELIKLAKKDLNLET